MLKKWFHKVKIIFLETTDQGGNLESVDYVIMRKTLSICFDQIKKYLSKKHCKLLSQFLEEIKEEEEIAGR